MDISEGELIQVKKEEDTMFHEILYNDIKTEKVKEEPRDPVFFIECEICNQNSPNEAECVHIKNNRLGDLEQDNKMQVPSLYPADDMHTNSSKEDVKPDNNRESSSSQKEGDFTMKLIYPEATIKEEEYVDSPEYLSTDLDLVQCEIGQVKTEDDNIFYENVKIECVKEEPMDNETSLSSDMLAQDEDSIGDVQPGSSKESQKAVANTKNKKSCLVPGCKSSTVFTPNKIFIPVPRDKNERLSWQRAMRKTDYVSPRSYYYCCEDHFKLEEDAENYMQFKMMGNVKLKMKSGVVPSLFACQKVPAPPREYPSKRCLPDVVMEAGTSAKKSRQSQAKEVRNQGTQTEYHLYLRDVGVQVNLCDDEEAKQTQSITKKAPKKRTKKIK